MKRGFVKKIRKYGFLAEPFMLMTESMALKLTLSEGEPSFDRIAASARAKHLLADEAWAPVERLLQGKRKGNGAALRRGWVALASVLLLSVSFFAFTKTGQALAGDTVKLIEQKLDHGDPLSLSEERFFGIVFPRCFLYY